MSNIFNFSNDKRQKKYLVEKDFRDLRRSEIDHILITMQQWQHIQHQLMLFTRTAVWSLEGPVRQAFETYIRQCTDGHAQIYWEPCASEAFPEDAQLIVVSFSSTRYGFLALTPGFLVSDFFPTIPQDFASLCAQILMLVEYTKLIKHQAKHLSEPCVSRMSALTQREREVLASLCRGESEVSLAQHLGIEPTTAHTHRQRLYQRLDVHTAQEAVLRGFLLRLLNWLDFS